MTTETTIEAKRIPVVPDKALCKAAGLASAEVRICWMLNDEGQKQTQAIFLGSGREITASNNTILVALLFDRIAQLEAQLEEFTDAE
jgi:hypothetical protein